MHLSVLPYLPKWERQRAASLPVWRLRELPRRKPALTKAQLSRLYWVSPLLWWAEWFQMPGRDSRSLKPEAQRLESRNHQMTALLAVCQCSLSAMRGPDP